MNYQGTITPKSLNSAGKGDKYRKVNKKRYNKNYDNINWENNSHKGVKINKWLTYATSAIQSLKMKRKVKRN